MRAETLLKLGTNFVFGIEDDGDGARRVNLYRLEVDEGASREQAIALAAALAAAAPAADPAAIVADVAEGIRVLATRDGLQISEEQITERARNIAGGLLGNFTVAPR